MIDQVEIRPEFYPAALATVFACPNVLMDTEVALLWQYLMRAHKDPQRCSDFMEILCVSVPFAHANTSLAELATKAYTAALQAQTAADMGKLIKEMDDEIEFLPTHDNRIRTLWAKHFRPALTNKENP